MCDNMIWCTKGFQKRNHAFNEPCHFKRVKEIKEASDKLGFVYDPKIGWTESWEKVKDWTPITSLPEYDEEIVKKITGLSSIPTSNTKTIDGKSYSVSEDENGVLTFTPLNDE